MRSTKGSIRFLLCDSTREVGLTFLEEKLVTSPIQCLEKAVDEIPGLIAIRFGKIPIRERETLVELSAALKRNSHTRNCLILALLHSKHRKLIEDLTQSKVDYIRYIDDITLDLIQMRKIIDELGPDDRAERHLAMLCPFLHYDGIDSQHEMTVCGAYLDRMVLGGRRLHDLCEAEGHPHCEYYRNPRCKS